MQCLTKLARNDKHLVSGISRVLPQTQNGKGQCIIFCVNPEVVEKRELFL